MKRSTERFLTTHTGSLPRPDDLIRTMFAHEEGVPVDRAALAAARAAAVADSVESQAEAGIDIVNDGEMSKPSYATYIKDRLDGFGGESHPLQYQDLVDFPSWRSRVFGDPGRARRKTPGCTGPVARARYRGGRRRYRQSPRGDRRRAGRGGLPHRRLAGLISLFFHNGHYPTHEAYLEAIAAAMQPEYAAIVAAGFVLQLDCPDLAMGRHIQFAKLDTRRIPHRPRAAYRGDEPCGREHSRRIACASICAGAITRGRIITTCRWRHHRRGVRRAAGRAVVRGRQSPPRA